MVDASRRRRAVGWLAGVFALALSGGAGAAPVPAILTAANNADLGALATTDAPNGLQRCGYLLPGDSPCLPMQPSSSACSLVAFVGTVATATVPTNRLNVTVATSGTLRPGLVMPAGVFAAGTIISSQVSGTPGGVGVYQLSQPFSPPPSFTLAVKGDGASQVPAADGGCWLAQFAGTADIRIWGARPGASADDALDDAIAFACANHVPVFIPTPGKTQFQLSRAHTIGNGSPSTTSSCNAVTIAGDPAVPENATQAQTLMQFVWTGGAGVVPLTLRGPATAISLKRIGIDCAGICSTGFVIDNILDSEYGWLGVASQIGTAFVFTSTGVTNTWGGGLENDWVHDIFAASPGTGGSGVQIGDTACSSSCTAATISNHFERFHTLYDGNTAGTFGLRLGMVVQSALSNFEIVKLNGVGSSGDCLQIAAPSGLLTTPTDVLMDHVFCDTDVNRAAGGAWAPSTGGIHILDWSTAFHAPPIATGVPSSQGYETIWGQDSTGRSFGNGPYAWTPTDASGASLSLTNGGSIWTRLPHSCAVSFDITYPSTANANAASINGLPAPCNTPSSGHVMNGGMGYTTIGAATSVFCDSASDCGFYNLSGVGLTNAGVSGKRIVFSTSYPTLN